MKKKPLVEKILGPSPMLFCWKQTNLHLKTKKKLLAVRGGSSIPIDSIDVSSNPVKIAPTSSSSTPPGPGDMCMSDEAFFEMIQEQSKPPRLKNGELPDFMNPLKNKNLKLNSEQKLIKSMIEEAELTRKLSQQNFKSLEELYRVRRKYKTYLRCKRLIPIGVTAPFTGLELSKMSYAAAMGSKSIALTLPGFVGYSLPAFFFCHMGSYYAPNKLKRAFEIGKYTLGAPLWIASTITDGLLAGIEESTTGEIIPIDLPQTGGTVPGNLGNMEDYKKLMEDLKNLGKEFGVKD